MTDEADSSVVLAELQVALFRERNNQRLSPRGRPFSCPPDPVTDLCQNINHGLPASLNKFCWYIINSGRLRQTKANVSDAEASFLDLHLSISDGFVKTKIYDKRDDFDFDIVNFPFLDGDVPRSASYGVYISQLIRFARVSSHVDDFNTRNKVLTAKLLRQGYRYHKLRKAFSKFYRRHFDIVSKYNVGLKTLLLQGLSEPEFYGDLVYKFRKIIGKIGFPYHFKKIIVRYKKIGYNINVMRQTACLVVNPIKVNSFAYLFNCTTVGRASD